MIKKLLFIFIIAVVYFLPSPRETHFNHFSLLAQSFVAGRLDITPLWQPHLERAVVGSKFYVPYPPTPALFVLPFLPFLKPIAQQSYAALTIGLLNIVLAYMLIDTITPQHDKARWHKVMWFTVFFALSTLNWFFAVFGWSWFLTHLVILFFILLMLLCIMRFNQPLLAGIFYGGAVASRVPALGAGVFALWWYGHRKNGIKLSLFPFIIGSSISIGVFLLYNYVAFGHLTMNTGYQYIPGIMQEPWFDKGLFHPSYLWRNLEILFLKLPVARSSFPYLVPSRNGLAIWIVSPLVIFSVFAKLKHPLTIPSWLATITILLPALFHGHVGTVQFGYRRAMDALPFLLILTAVGTPAPLRSYHKVFIAVGIMIIAWGIICFRNEWLGW